MVEKQLAHQSTTKVPEQKEEQAASITEEKIMEEVVTEFNATAIPSIEFVSEDFRIIDDLIVNKLTPPQSTTKHREDNEEYGQASKEKEKEGENTDIFEQDNEHEPIQLRPIFNLHINSSDDQSQEKNILKKVITASKRSPYVQREVNVDADTLEDERKMFNWVKETTLSNL